eukprot:366577-Chlamydomonas_euryale.AAC.17
MWGEAGPPPDLATRLFTERIIYLVRPCVQPRNVPTTAVRPGRCRRVPAHAASRGGLAERA